MATKTSNYNLIKPEDNDFYDINNFIGENMELIDAALKPTANPEQAPIGNVGKLTQWVSWLTNRIKAITGGVNWYDAPDITLADTATQITNEANARANADTALGNLISTKLTKFVGTTAGTGSALTANIEGVTLTDYVNVQVRLHADIADNATININALGEKQILLNTGEPITNGAVAGAFLNLIYSSASSGAWYLLDNVKPESPFEENMIQFFAIPGASGKIRLKVEKPADADGVMIRWKSSAWASGDTKDTGTLVASITNDSGYKGANQWYDASGLTDGTAYYFKAFPYKGSAYNETIGVNETLCKAGGLYAEYTMDSISGNTLLDTSGNSRDATITQTLISEAAKVGNGIKGNSSGYVELTSVLSGLVFPCTITMFANAKGGATTRYRALWFTINNYHAALDLGDTSSATKMRMRSFGATFVDYPSIDMNADNFLLFGSDGNYRINNQAYYHAPASESVSPAPKVLLGDRYIGSTYANGKSVLDQVRFFSRILEPYEVNNLYNGGAGC